MDVMNVLWKEVQSAFVDWKEPGQYVEGLLVEKESDVGSNASMVYHVELPEGDAPIRKVWGTGFLDELMLQVPVGSLVRIEYMGLGEAKKGQNAPKLFKVRQAKNPTIPDRPKYG